MALTISSANEITKRTGGSSGRWTVPRRPRCAPERMEAAAVRALALNLAALSGPGARLRAPACAAASSAGGVVNVSLRNVQKKSPRPQSQGSSLWTNSIGGKPDVKFPD